MSEEVNKLTPYHLLGGEAVLRQLVDRFYQIMAEEPKVLELRKMHPEDLQGSADKLYMFLSGWLGGPDLYQQKFGHPMLRARHMPFPIDSSGRDQWMFCMIKALSEVPMEAALKAQLEQAFFRTADFMRNQDA
ncbi:group II truncated hemoglobin [Leeia sp. TBRC 13508]|uniref:Group II truncated hemoglobin n=1 Tax=Leeia speluncae TaxID=2884804 RepID=A0ABS8D829_9NEIS|nr:group II truncated hemoglobin [Leeia speluncae]MCB6184364.1 group II truncated hemoglobin [Leeia speluncae]